MVKRINRFAVAEMSCIMPATSVQAPETSAEFGAQARCFADILFVVQCVAAKRGAPGQAEKIMLPLCVSP